MGKRTVGSAGMGSPGDVNDRFRNVYKPGANTTPDTSAFDKLQKGATAVGKAILGGLDRINGDFGGRKSPKKGA